MFFYYYPVTACKKTSFRDDAPKERRQADREWVGGAAPF
jgi:hypothetical protein